MIPIADGSHCIALRFREVVHSTGVVEPCGERVIECDLESVVPDVFSWSRCERTRSDKQTAVAVIAELEIQLPDKVRPLLSVNEHVMSGSMWVDR